MGTPGGRGGGLPLGGGGYPLGRIVPTAVKRYLEAAWKELNTVNVDIFTQLNFRASSPMEHIRVF